MRAWGRWLACVAAVAGWAWAAPAPGSWFGGSGDAARVARAIARVYPALVRVEVVSEEPSRGRMERRRGSGSGTIISRDGYVITNHHVAGRATRIVCRLADGREIPARMVGTDALADIAVLQLDLSALREGERLPVAGFGDSDGVRVGDGVMAMGSPGGLNQSVTRGIASNTALLLPREMAGSMRLDGEDVGSLVRWIAHDARIYPGNSGGPLVNMRGEIIGVNEIGVAGLGGAIPGNLARAVAEELIRSGEMRRSWTGMLAQPRLKSGTAERGVLIGGVLPGTPAEAAGLQAGDVLVAFDGRPVDAASDGDMPEFNALVLSTPIGRAVPVEIDRAGERLTKELCTDLREAAQPPSLERKEWGLTIQPMTRIMMLELGRTAATGAVVTSVRVGGPCAVAEPAIRDGDVIVQVNDDAIGSVEDLTAVTGRLCEGRSSPLPVLVAFERGRNRMLTVARIGGERPAESPTPSRKPEFPVVLQPVNQELARRMGLPAPSAARVAFVIPGRSAERAGFRTGDVVLKADGEPVRASRPEDVELFMQTIRRYRIGAEVPFEIWRDGKVETIALTLEEAADTADDPARYTDVHFEFTVRDLMLMDRVERRLPDGFKGVLIDHMEPASEAQLAGVRPGDLLMQVDGEAVPDVLAAERLLRQAVRERPARIIFFVRRGIATLFLELEPDWDGRPVSEEPAEPAPNPTPKET
jgi:serine protease Do